MKDGSVKSGVIVVNNPDDCAVIRATSGREEVIWYSDVAGHTADPLPRHYPMVDQWLIRSAEVLSSATSVHYDSLYRVRLKNGIVKTGVVIEDNRFESLVLLLPGGEEWRFFHSNIESIASEPMPAGTKFLSIRHYSPPIAGMCSLLLPGGGQYYNGDYETGALLTCAAAFGVGLAVIEPNEFGDVLCGVILFEAAHITSLISAILTANAREKAREEWQYEREFLASPEHSGVRYNFGIAPLPKGATVGLSVRF